MADASSNVRIHVPSGHNISGAVSKGGLHLVFDSQEKCVRFTNCQAEKLLIHHSWPCVQVLNSEFKTIVSCVQGVHLQIDSYSYTFSSEIRGFTSIGIIAEKKIPKKRNHKVEHKSKKSKKQQKLNTEI